MTNYRKKLIEVSLPLAAINVASAREKSIRHGHPSTLHLWWARRPLAACRAVLFSSLVDDPDSDPQYRTLDGSTDEDSAGIKRADLFNLIEELVIWENSNNPEVIRSARAEIARCVASRKIELKELDPELVLSPANGKNAEVTVRDLMTKGHCRPQPMGFDKKAGRVRFIFDVSRLPPADVINAFLAEHAPPVLDPFAGGGSIPLEAQRLGMRAYASDLNPVPVLINKALIEIPPKFAGRPPVSSGAQGEFGASHGKKRKEKTLLEKEWPGATGLAEDVRYYGQWVRDEAEHRIGHLYPKVTVTEEMAKDRTDLRQYIGEQLTIVSWLWARTVASPNPACGGVHVPLIRSFWLASKSKAKIWLKPIIDPKRMTYRLEVRSDAGEPQEGTVTRNGGVCLVSKSPIPLEYIREQGRSGKLATRMIAIVAAGHRGRVYLPASEEQESLAKLMLSENQPDTDLPEEALGFRVQNYGMTKHRHLFSPRQMTSLIALGELVNEARAVALNDSGGDQQYANAIATYLALAVDRVAMTCNTLGRWNPVGEKVQHVFGRQALSMVWDFPEANILGTATGSWDAAVELIADPLSLLGNGVAAEVVQVAAQQHAPMHCPLYSTDPPYYDNVPYADLADFFYVWLRRNLASIYPDLLSTVLVPKADELVADPFRRGGKEAARNFFEEGMTKTLMRMRKHCNGEYPTTIYYAFKQSESDEESDDDGEVEEVTQASTGWETMLDGLVRAGWQIDGTWPMRTEMKTRMRSMGSNALASSIVLVCRPRPDLAPLATRKDFITALRRELPDSLRNLQRGNIAPVDLAQAAIGPGMAVYTRYSKVLESDGTPLTVRTALGLINQTLDEVLSEQEGEFDGDTRWALAWFEQFGMEDGAFGDAETLSKAKNTAINGLVEAGIIAAKSGKVRLIRRDELPSEWNPAGDKRLTVWEVTQHLIHRLDEQGEMGAASLVGQLAGIGEVARDLAYRLYSTCERKKWSQDAMAYNSLVVAWPELTKLAQAARTLTPSAQRDLF